MSTDPRDDARNFAERFRRLTAEVGRVVVGQEAAVHAVLACLVTGGHCLLEGVPGIGKTLLVRTLAAALNLEFRRIQFTPDLMPADVTGTMVLAEEGGSRSFRFEPGPVFANLVLADEINRATPKTQSSLLEAMQEQAVTVAGVTRKLPAPFAVLATQNPVEMEGTYPLPEAQLDRFLLKVLVGPPTRAELLQIVRRTTSPDEPIAERVMDGPEVLRLRRLVRGVILADHVADFANRLVIATHPGEPSAPEEVRRYVRYGSSPRGAQALVLSAKVSALLDGRVNVAMKDIAALALPALRHRVLLTYEAEADGVSADTVVRAVLAAVPARDMLSGEKP
ncbi:MAG: AAA family ATPase [Planctomycetes bacterium]|jgi:MoxR-like ATPase|nr:AAA family ATPase [Planctomycetota bacterium]